MFRRGLGHVRVRMARGFLIAVELTFHGRDVDDVLVAVRRPQHQRLEARVDDERRDGVDELHFEQLHRRDLVHQQAPGIAPAQVDLLQILIEPSLRKQIALVRVVFRQQRHLRQLRGVRQARDLRHRGRRAVVLPVGSMW